MKCKLCGYKFIISDYIPRHFYDNHVVELIELSSYKLFIDQVKLYYCDGV